MDDTTYHADTELVPLTFRQRIAVAFDVLRGTYDPDLLEVSDKGAVVTIGSICPLEGGVGLTYVLRARYQNMGAVGLGFTTPTGDGLIVLTPRGARSFAAGMLNAADMQDGTVPLFAFNEKATE